MNRFLAAVALVIGAGSCVESFFGQNILVALECKAALAPTSQELLAMSGATATCLVKLNILALLEGFDDYDAQAPMPGPGREAPMPGPDRARQPKLGGSVVISNPMITLPEISLPTITGILTDLGLNDEVRSLNYCIADEMGLVDQFDHYDQERLEDYIMQKVSSFRVAGRVYDALDDCPGVSYYDTAAFMACVLTECISS